MVPQRFYATGRPAAADRPPLPPGSPETWTLLTRGTVFKGLPYPAPVERSDLIRLERDGPWTTTTN